MNIIDNSMKGQRFEGSYHGLNRLFIDVGRIDQLKTGHQRQHCYMLPQAKMYKHVRTPLSFPFPIKQQYRHI